MLRAAAAASERASKTPERGVSHGEKRRLPEILRRYGYIIDLSAPGGIPRRGTASSLGSAAARAQGSQASFDSSSRRHQQQETVGAAGALIVLHLLGKEMFCLAHWTARTAPLQISARGNCRTGARSRARTTRDGPQPCDRPDGGDESEAPESRQPSIAVSDRRDQRQRWLRPAPPMPASSAAVASKQSED